MIAITRSACSTPSSISWASSLASATEWIGTLRTSIASGMRPLSPTSLGYDDGASVAVHRGAQVREVGDDRTRAAVLDEATGRVHLRPHRPAGEVALGGVRPQLLDGHGVDVGGLGRAVVQHRVRYVGRDDEHVGLDGPGQQ